MTKPLIATLVLVFAGCTTLPSLDQKCGNGVIDDDEDCDNPSASCIHCALACNATGGCDLAGYCCASDHLCHAPSGVFEQAEATSFLFPVGNGAPADIDGDGIGDVIGFSDITIDVHFGDRNAKLDTEAQTLVPFANANATLRPIGEDNVDILLPTADGIAAFAAQSKLVLPYPFSNAPNTKNGCPELSNATEALSFMTINKALLGVVRRDTNDNRVSLTMLDIVPGKCGDAVACNMKLDPLVDALLVDHYETTSATGFESAVVAIEVVHRLPAPSELCILRVKATAPPAPRTYTVTALSSGVPLLVPPGPIALARSTQGAVCPSLFVPKLAIGIGYYPGTLAGECTVDLASTATLTGVSASAFPAGHIPLLPTIGSFAPDALVTVSSNGTGGTTDIYVLNGNTAPKSLMHSTRPLYPIESGDLDGNGSVEAIASAAGQSLDIDVLYRTPPPAQGFVTYRISTQNVPKHVVVADYDGNGLADIAYTETVGSRDRLMVAYGTPDRPTPAVEITTFANIVAITHADIPDSIEPTGQSLDDLIVLDLGPTGSPLLTVLHGNPQRSMIAYYDPRDFSTQAADPTEFLTVIPGNFNPMTPPLDVLALELHVIKRPSTVDLWLINGKGGEALEDRPRPSLKTQIGGIPCGMTSLLCAGTGIYLPWQISDGAGVRDVVIAIDNEQLSPVTAPTHHLVTIDPLARDLGGGVSIKPAPTMISDPAFAHTMLAADVDGDGRNDLVLSFGPRRLAGAERASLELCQVADDGAVTSCEDLQAKVPELGAVRCVDVATGNMSARGRHDPTPTGTSADLMFLCHDPATNEDAIFRIAHSAAGFHATRVLSHMRDTGAFKLGDVNGDDVDDVIGVTFDQTRGLPTIHVFRQCEAKDAVCRRTNGGTP